MHGFSTTELRRGELLPPWRKWARRPRSPYIHSFLVDKPVLNLSHLMGPTGRIQVTFIREELPTHHQRHLLPGALVTSLKSDVGTEAEKSTGFPVLDHHIDVLFFPILPVVDVGCLVLVIKCSADWSAVLQSYRFDKLSKASLGQGILVGWF